MYKHFEEIEYLNEKMNVNKALAVCKLFEETGELVQKINIDLDIKRGDKNAVREGVLEELADSIQNLFSIANLYNISYDELSDELEKKNNKWNSYAQERLDKKK